MPRSLFSVHPRILMDLPRPPPRLIPRSPWNFYQFLSSDVPRSSFLKFPEDPDDSSSLFLHRIFIVFLRDCLPYSSLFFSPPPFLLPPSLIFFLRPRSFSCHPPGLYYCLLHARFLRGSIRLSWPLSVLSLLLSRPCSSLFANPVIFNDFPERPPPSTPPSRIPTRDNPYKLEH